MPGSELEWARKAWLILEQERLTAYDTALDLTRVQIRLVTLAVFYWDFCELAHEEFFSYVFKTTVGWRQRGDLGWVGLEPTTNALKGRCSTW